LIHDVEKEPALPSSASLVSVVVPALNETLNLVPLYERLLAVFNALDQPWELIVVDDGSTDDSAATLAALHVRDPRVSALLLTRSFGQDAAISAGLKAARGNAVVVMDADGQDPPEVIPALIDRWKAGNKIVAGRRARRVEHSAFKRACAFGFYRLMRAAVGWDYLLDSGEFRLMDRAVVDVLNACPQRNRLMRALSSWTGFSCATVEYTQERRMHGETKYSFRRSLRLALTGLTAFSVAPLRIAVWLGILTIAGSIIVSFPLLASPISNSPASWLAWGVLGLWLLGGVQCLLIGILGEYIWRGYLELQQRPLFIIEQTIGLDRGND
jgi:dolichol-phosphate mannosyltransferase